MHGSFLACIETLHSPGSNGPGEVLMVSTPGMYDAIRTTEVKEAGLNTVVNRSFHPGAERFKRWVDTHILAKHAPAPALAPEPEQAAFAPEGFQIFESNEFGQVRVLTGEDGEPRFVAKDVCDVLGIANSRDALARLDEDEKNTVVITDGNRGNPNVSVINESGLYHLTITSRKPFAKRFRKWLTAEVAPDIRRHGVYATNDAIEDALSDPDNWIKILEEIKKERAEKARIASERDEAVRTKSPECPGS